VKRAEVITRAIRNQLVPCGKCGKPEWWHKQKQSERCDDGHVFKRVKKSTVILPQQ